MSFARGWDGALADVRTQRAACNELGQMGAAAAPHAGAVAALLGHEHAFMRGHACQVLGGMGAAAGAHADAVAALVAGEKELWSRETARDALKQIAPDHPALLGAGAGAGAGAKRQKTEHDGEGGSSSGK